MPYRPPPRCLECLTIISDWSGRGARPKFCSQVCKVIHYNRLPRGFTECERPGCRRQFQRTHSAHRFCSEQCRYGCRWCGNSLPPRDKNTRRNFDYCSPECKSYAWQDIPFPPCKHCGRNIPVVASKARRDPPQTCRDCLERQRFDIDRQINLIEGKIIRYQNRTKRERNDAAATKANIIVLNKLREDRSKLIAAAPGDIARLHREWDNTHLIAIRDLIRDRRVK